jgi:hypothetical protein
MLLPSPAGLCPAGLAEATLASSVSSDEIFRKLLTDDRIIGDDIFTTGGAV